MRTLLFCVLSIVMLTTYSFSNRPKSRLGIDQVRQEQELEGAYEFVSETLELIKPKPATERSGPPDWMGLWFFKSGHFSQTMMKKGRGFLAYPKSHADVGYESSAGTYTLDGNTIQLEKDLSLHPLSIGRTQTLEYRIEGDTIIFVETMHPYTENVAEAKRTIVLRRIK